MNILNGILWVIYLRRVLLRLLFFLNSSKSHSTIPAPVMRHFPNTSFPLTPFPPWFRPCTQDYCKGISTSLLQWSSLKTFIIPVTSRMECQLITMARVPSCQPRLTHRCPALLRAPQPRLWFTAHTQFQLLPLSFHPSQSYVIPSQFTLIYDCSTMIPWGHWNPRLAWLWTIIFLMRQHWHVLNAHLSPPSDVGSLRASLTLAPWVPRRAHGTWCVFCRRWTESSCARLALFCRNLRPEWTADLFLPKSLDLLPGKPPLLSFSLPGLIQGGWEWGGVGHNLDTIAFCYTPFEKPDAPVTGAGVWQHSTRQT